MKKFFIVALMAVMGLGASAQLVKSRTFVEKKSNTMWYVRLGMSMNNAAGKGVDNCLDWYDDGSEAGAKVGYDFSVGFHKPISDFGLYWGMEYGLGTRGAKATLIDKYHDEESELSLLAHNIKISPITFGYKYSITDDLKLDAHIGAYASYDYYGKGNEKLDGRDYDNTSIYDLDDYNSFDCGLQAGIGVWFDRFNLDFTYQRGFMNVSSDEGFRDYDGELGGVYSSNFMIRLGVAF